MFASHTRNNPKKNYTIKKKVFSYFTLRTCIQCHRGIFIIVAIARKRVTFLIESNNDMS